MSMLALEKLGYLWQTIKANGGIIGQLSKMWRMDTFKCGTLKGWDENGNKYYENCRFMMPRNRWVEFNPIYKFEYDASHVAPEWYGWLHHKTDLLPCQDCAKYCLYCNGSTRNWLLPAEENLSSTKESYYPYSTTRDAIQVWDDSPLCRACMEADETATHVPMDCMGVANYRAKHLGDPRSLQEVVGNIKGLLGFLQELGWQE